MSTVFLLCRRLMSLLEVTAEKGGYRLAEGECSMRRRRCDLWFQTFAVLLVLVVSMLGMRPSSCASLELAANAELAIHVDDDTQGDIPIADSWGVDDCEISDEGGDDDDPRTELLLSLSLLSAFTPCEASLAPCYRSFVSEPSTPPPRA